jgi:molybdopterin-guanine dinucleotide biosynthesis protein A
VPCDSPLFPEDLVARLAARLEADDAEVAIAATREDGELRLQPVFCLMQATVLESLVRFTASGRRKIDAWTATLRQVAVEFDDAQAFVNANTVAELRDLQR